MICASLVLGTVVLAPIPNADPMKYQLILHHAEVGFAILSLMLLRLVIRLSTTSPEPVRTGGKVLAGLSHRGFYILVFAQCASGITLAVQVHLPQMLLAGEVGYLPPTFWLYSAREWHYVISRLLMGLIALHLGGVLYHTLFRRDHLLGRVWFGRRNMPYSKTNSTP